MRLPRPRSISLANKTLLLFGGAIAIILFLAMIPPWLRMRDLTAEYQLEYSRQAVDLWIRLEAQAREANQPVVPGENGLIELGGIRVRVLSASEAEAFSQDDSLIRRLLDASPGTTTDAIEPRSDGSTRVYHYSRVIHDDEGLPTRLLVLERQGEDTGVLLILNTVYLFSAGFLIFLLAVLGFYLVIHRLMLAPVRALRQTADGVRKGDLTIRSTIRTGDEFEDLARTFNQMLSVLQASQEHERSVNRALDLKIHELNEANNALFESNRVKSEFLANVSHELRTPMNAIIGFANLLLEIAEREREDSGESRELKKRTKYQKNIAIAGSHLLYVIESLLEMAKIEAGRVQVDIDSVSISATCEGLMGLIQPLADQRDVKVRVEIAGDLPLIQTDAKKLHQILFNLLSNAVKFSEPSPAGGQAQVILTAKRLYAPGDDEIPSVRVAVRDTGPGIPEDERERIFEKFHQVEGGPAKRHTGTGLGLAISRELAAILQGTLTLETNPGQGSTFTLTLPIEPDETLGEEIRLERNLRADLASPKDWGIDSSVPADGVGEVADSDV